MSSKGKLRLSELLVSRGFSETIAEAERAVLAGNVLGAGVPLTQPGALVDPGLEIRIRTQRKFVSRGGDKLLGALEDFALDPSGLRCLDAGASTGGFTDCLLQQGASLVVAVDVAYGQFAWRLRNDPRVKLYERCNLREIDPGLAGAPFDLVVADLSFTSLQSIMPVLTGFSADQTRLIALVKPQFELPSSQTDEGVIRDQAAHMRALDQVIKAADINGFAPQSATFSQITGPKGNIEFFLMAQYAGIPATIDTHGVVSRAHERLGRKQ